MASHAREPILTMHRTHCCPTFLRLATTFGLTAAVGGLATAQTVLPPFNAHYAAQDLGGITGVLDYGGVTFAAGNPNQLLVSAFGSGTIRAVGVLRDAQGHVVGTTASTIVATVNGNDGGLAVGPNGVLFFTQYPANVLGQILPGASSAAREIDLTALGVDPSVGSCAFVPAGRAGAGRLKIATYSTSTWHELSLAPSADGTFAVTGVPTTIALGGGIEGIAYPPANAPLLGTRVLVAEWSDGVVAWQCDGNGDPIPGTRQPVIANTGSIGGGAVDPLTGDVLFLCGGGRLLSLRTNATCGAITSYGPASPGAFLPTLVGSGCARLGQSVTLTVGGAPATFGVLTAGSAPLSVPFANLTVLTTLETSFPILLGGNGQFVLPIAIPVVPALGNSHLYLQAGLLDASTASGLSASAGLDLWIR